MKRKTIGGALLALVNWLGLADALEGSRLAGMALKSFCATAVDTIPAVFGDGRHAPPVEYRCIKARGLCAETGADEIMLQRSDAE